MTVKKVAVVIPAEIRRDVVRGGNRDPRKIYGPTTLVMLFDSPEQLAEIRRILNGGAR